MEYRHLVSFLAIAEELHFGRAADRLHLTQPSLSQQLKRLERTLRVQLVARSSHDVHLTSAGKAFETEARSIVNQMSKATSAVREVAAGRTGTVRVGYNFPAGQHVLPRTLARMHAEVPGVTVELQEKRTGPQLAALADGTIDVALVYGRPVSPELRYRRLLQVPMVAVVGACHKWAGRPGVPFSELGRQPCILFARDQSPAMYDTIIAATERTGISINVTDTVNDPGATAILVSIKPLIGFASASRGMLVGSVSGGVRPIPVQLYDPVPMIDLYAVWQDGVGPLGEVFLDCLDAVGPFQSPSFAMRSGR